MLRHCRAVGVSPLIPLTVQETDLAIVLARIPASLPWRRADVNVLKGTRFHEGYPRCQVGHRSSPQFACIDGLLREALTVDNVVPPITAVVPSAMPDGDQSAAQGQRLRAICYYDDDCGVCEAAKDFFLSRAPNGALEFIGRSQAERYQHTFPEGLTEQTIVVYNARGEGPWLRSRAFAELVKPLAWYWQPLRALSWPGVILFANLGYRIFAANRQRISSWLGLKQCRVRKP